MAKALKRYRGPKEETIDEKEGASLPKHLKSLHERTMEQRLIVVLEHASLETVKAAADHELLNCDKHRHLMKKLKRDPAHCRPDITHQSLLMLMDSPLNRAGKLEVFIHTERNILIKIHPQTRIPRTFDRFCGLMVQLLFKLKIRAADGPHQLLKIVKNPVTDHLPTGVPKILMSAHADKTVNVREMVPQEGPVVVVIGAMAHGSVKVDYTNDQFCISNYPLSAALTCSKLCSGFEEVWGIL